MNLSKEVQKLIDKSIEEAFRAGVMHMRLSIVDASFGLHSYGEVGHFLDKTVSNSEFMDDVLKEGIKLLNEVNE